ncbi:DeoR family transcriptional regulator [soil metagenome]
MTAHAQQPLGKARWVDNHDEELLAQVSRRYYLEDTSKVEIARALDISRFKVARLLQAARDRGIVQISITVPGRVDSALSAELADRLRRARSVVVDTTGNELTARRQVAAAAAEILPGLVPDNALLGLTWSRTIDAMVDALGELPRCTAIQLCGSLAAPAGSATTLDVVQRVARLAGGVAHQVHAPLVVDDAAAAAALRRQPGIQDTLRLADELDVCVVAVGAWRARCSTVWEVVSQAVRTAGTRSGAVAEVSGRLLGPTGEAVESPLDDLVIGASLTQLQRADERVALVNGPHRAQAVIAAAGAGIVTTLVTTSDIAREVLKLGTPG